MNIHATTLRFTLFFRVSVYWFMYSVITSEMRLYDGNWWQPVVIFRWLMMRASLRGNRSKQLIYTARHNSHSSVSRPNSGKRWCLFVCSRACGHLFGGERAGRRGNRGLCSWYVLNATQNTFECSGCPFCDPYFLMNAQKWVMSEAC